MLLADVQKQFPAYAVESDFPVVLPAGLLLRKGKLNPQGFQCFLLLRLNFTVAVFDIEHLPGVNVGTGFIQME